MLGDAIASRKLEVWTPTSNWGPFGLPWLHSFCEPQFHFLVLSFIWIPDTQTNPTQMTVSVMMMVTDLIVVIGIDFDDDRIV